MVKKLTKKQEKNAINSIGKIIVAISNKLDDRKKGFIDEMVQSMKAQAEIIARAKINGINIMDIMPEIKEEYNRQK